MEIILTKGIFKTAKSEKLLELNENTLITSLHQFDLIGSIIIGKNTTIAGRNLNLGLMGLIFILKI